MTRSSKSPFVSALRWGLIGAVSISAAAVGASGCLDRPLCASVTSEESKAGLPEDFSGDCTPKTTNVFVDAITQRSVDKIDLLFMIDNSISMADKQKVLERAVPDLVERLVNPVCVNEETREQRVPPTDVDAPCTDPGFVREFNAIKDIHIGVVSSSLGSYGSNACDPTLGEQQDDKAHLIGARPRALGLNLSQSGAEGTPGFLAWDPSQQIDVFSGVFQQLVVLTGENGCGYEASLESWYRFLVDPSPPAAIEIVACSASNPAECARPAGIDEQLLAQRRAFLRSDSLLAIAMLTDENDCSIQGTGQLYYAARGIALPQSTPVCNLNPNDPCCYSCALNPPADCTQPKPPECTGTPNVPTDLDNRNLRCWEQKRRFGVDFLYPIERYVRALSAPMLCPRTASLDPAACSSEELMANPLFQDLSGAGGNIRGPDLVFIAGIIGVPWQDIQATADAEGVPFPGNELHFLTATQMTDQDTWADILGNPTGSPPSPALDPLMRESIAARSGTSATGTTLAGPNSGLMANEINGHEYIISRNDDLQYACIFPLEGDSKDCDTVDSTMGCDCFDDPVPPVDTHNPLCQALDGTYTNLQRYAKGYPGLRHLQLLKDFGANSIVASICPKQLGDEGAQDYGYRPAVGAIIDRLKEALAGRCLPREITVAEDGTVPCSVVEALPGDAGCGRAGRAEPDEVVIEPTFARLEQLGRCGAGQALECNRNSWSICTVVPSEADSNGDGTTDCLQDGIPATDVGWCYVDPDNQRGDPALVDKCPASERRLLRFVDPATDTPANGATVLIACLGADFENVSSSGNTPPAPTATATGGGGTPPVPPAGDAGP